jgi:hypothetical protein
MGFGGVSRASFSCGEKKKNLMLTERVVSEGNNMIFSEANFSEEYEKL